MKAHILDHLITTGVLSPDGTGRRASARTCPRCKVNVLAGDDADRIARLAVVDPTPLNQLGEALVLLEGRATYDLMLEGERLVLNPRTGYWITRRPAGTWLNSDVVPEHVCRRVPSQWTTTSVHYRPVHHDARPPF